MNTDSIIQLVTLWFVVIIFIQTSTEGGGVFNVVIETIAILLVWIIPLIIVIYSILGLTDG